MSQSIASATEPMIQCAKVSDDTITAHLADGRVISVPPAWSWRLSDATPAQRTNWQLIGGGHGVHWPDVDEDISAEGMLSGIPARRPTTRRRAGAHATPSDSEPRRRVSKATARG
jgi:hypothetical protein